MSLPPPTAYAGLYQWLSPTSVVTSGATVTQINDLSGAGHPASACVGITTGGTFPNGALGLIVPNSGSPGAETGAAVVPSVFQACTVFYVIIPTHSLFLFGGCYDCGYTNAFCLCLNATATAWKWITATPVSPYGTCEGGVPTLNQLTLLTAYQSGGQGTLRVNGVAVGSALMTAPSAGSGGFPLDYGGRTATGGASGQPGIIGDAAAFDQALPLPQIIALEGYFGAKYGISLPVYYPPSRTTKPRGKALVSFVIPPVSTVLNAGLKKLAAAKTPSIATSRRLHFTAAQLTSPAKVAEALFGLQTAIEYLQKFVTSSPLSSSSLMEGIAATNGTPFLLRHRLGRVPYGWFVVDALTAPWSGYRVPPPLGAVGPSGGPQEQDYLTIMPASTGTYSFLVF